MTLNGIAHLIIVIVVAIVGTFVLTGLVLATIIMAKEIKHQLRRRR
jgi:hypothetical protein